LDVLLDDENNARGPDFDIGFGLRLSPAVW
jgi:hypothetical protein